MLLSITSTTAPATDLGYLLFKNPARVHRANLSFGNATVFYPEASDVRCTMCLLLEVDPVGLVRRQGGPAGDGGVFDQYVNDRPYAASSFLSVAISEMFGTAMTGRSKDRPALAQTALPLEVRIPVLPSRSGEPLIRALFEPLGYGVEVARIPLDEKFPEWGSSRYYSVTLKGTQVLKDLLSHLNVLIPVLDDEKHYWVGDDEVDKLLRRGGDWLPVHPAKDTIAYRYLKHRRSLARVAVERLEQGLDQGEDNEDSEAAPELRRLPRREEALEARISLNTQRIAKVVEVVVNAGAKTVVDLGCGEGKLLQELLKHSQFERLIGMDVSLRSLETARDRLRLDQMGPTLRARIDLMQGSLVYRDKRLNGFDVATAIEVIEHLDMARLRAFERVLFECARPRTMVVTTPNAEFNVKFDSLPAGQFRHPDHRFEWSRAQFTAWAEGIGQRYGYAVRFDGIGEADAALGAPTQMAIFQAH